jgi:hypothetical protein
MAMSSPELTFDEVVEACLPAVSVTMADPDAPDRGGVYREWRYDHGEVWLIHRDAKHTYSMRLAAPKEIPWGGWHHDDRCNCAYCSGDRSGIESSMGPDDDGRSVR